MANRDIRIIDPILSNIARGYRNDAFVGMALFPRVTVTVSGGQILQFGKEAFMKYETRRAPGAATKRIDFGYEGMPFALENHALEALVPIEWQRDARAVPGVDLATRAIALTQAVTARQLEEQQATLATTAANYPAANVETLTGAGSLGAISNITEWIDSKKELIRSGIAQYPNKMFIGPKVFNVLRNLAAVRDNFKWTTSASITVAMLAQFLDIPQIFVGRAVGSDQAGNFGDIWGNDIVLAYAPDSPSGREEPSYGYTYTMEGHPAVKQPYFDDNRDSWVYGTKEERAPVIAGAAAAVLIKNAG
ncbi:MAG: hypothetical protein LBB65_07165 [Burkholderiales bacterium]|jgi:hypothetical protein|nr:hypothetical protein [Burkholderiales bacterium]